MRLLFPCIVVTNIDSPSPDSFGAFRPADWRRPFPTPSFSTLKQDGEGKHNCPGSLDEEELTHARIFYLLIALNAVTTVLFYFSYHPPSFSMKHGAARKAKFIKHFDYLGTLMFALGLLLFLMGISWGGTLHPWKSAAVICTIVLGFATLAGFILYENFMNLQEPILPLHLFRNRGWVVSIILWSIGAAVYYANAILWPSMVTAMYASGHSTAWAGWVSCIPGSGILAGEFVGAFFKRRTNLQLMIVFPIGCIFLAGKHLHFTRTLSCCNLLSKHG